MSRSKSRTCQKAEDWFIENREATAKEVAELFEVQEKTVGNWRKLHNWDTKREEYHSSPVFIKQVLQRELLKLANGEASTINADAIRKISATIDAFNKKVDPFVVKAVLEELDKFVAEIEPRLAAQMLQFHQRFLQHKIRQEA